MVAAIEGTVLMEAYVTGWSMSTGA